MSLSDYERAMLEEVAEDAAFRNDVRHIEGRWILGKLIGYGIVGLAVVGWLIYDFAVHGAR